MRTPPTAPPPAPALAPTLAPAPAVPPRPQMRFCRQLPTLLVCFLLNLRAIPEVCGRYHAHLDPRYCAGAPAQRGCPLGSPAPLRCGRAACAAASCCLVQPLA